MEVQTRGRPVLLRGGAGDGGELAHAGGIRQYIRHPLPPCGCESQSTVDDRATGDHGQGLCLLWSDCSIIPEWSRAAPPLVPRPSTADLRGVAAGSVRPGRWVAASAGLSLGAARTTHGPVYLIFGGAKIYASQSRHWVAVWLWFLS